MDSSLKFAVCDDVLQERKMIVDLLQEYMDIHDYSVKIDEYDTGEQLSAEATPVYHLVFLDIFMENTDGIQTAARLKEKNPSTQIVFNSVSNEYATQSYEVNALNYLVKPIQKEKIFSILDKYFHMYTSLKMLNYRQNRIDEKIYVSDILWIEAGDHKSIIHAKHGDIPTSTLLKNLAGQVDEKEFVKPIRYAIVSLAAIKEIPSDVLVLTDGTRIPISRSKRAEVSQAFKDYKMKKILQKGGII